MNYITLVFGLLLGFAFVGLMVFRVLPAADHIVKRERGTYEAMCFTRFCCLCIGLPFYVFTIWMTVVILFDGAPGISVLEEICPDDLTCSSTFAMGRTSHDKDACQSIDCGFHNLLARSGSNPLRFPTLGLGKPLTPIEETSTFECVKTDDDNGYCKEVKEIKTVKRECVTRSDDGECLLFEEKESEPGIRCFCDSVENVGDKVRCQSFSGCDNDIAEREVKTTFESDTAFTIETDSAKQFSFQECVCEANDVGDCMTFSCDVVSMQYFYPNIFYAGSATLLFVMPMMIIVYVLMKTHLRKIIKCGEPDMYVYSQEAGMQEETTGDDLVTGGFSNEQKQKTRYRKLGLRDIVTMLGGTAIVLFFSAMSVIVAGRVGVAFVALSASLIALVEIFNLYKFCVSSGSNVQDREATNMKGKNLY